ncbi:MAG: di-trans,poly-cis-decaprenylcistransferase [Proteobacteria bacterium]|nr:di-trans,poly-cis-decaprenylcistransferase [Pseudomonadota bacterium]
MFFSTMAALTSSSLPRHLAIIMDGNGRWAQARGKPRVFGHRKGADAVRKIVTACRERGIEVLTLFAFSSQNWSRPPFEVNSLMSLLFDYIKSEWSTILDNGIRLTTIGDIDLLPKVPRDALNELVQESAANTDMTLCLSLSYGGQEEIVSMARTIAERVSAGELDPSAIDKDVVTNSLWSSDLGPVDLLIRTSGEIRISNFLLWSIAYCELYFTDLMWPDFNEAALDKALNAYGHRHRRFGTVS